MMTIHRLEIESSKTNGMQLAFRTDKKCVKKIELITDMRIEMMAKMRTKLRAKMTDAI